jgi:HK97 family phage major capsid protein
MAKTITQYRSEIKTLMEKLGVINAAAAQNNRDLTMDEIKLRNEVMDHINFLQATVASMEREETLQNSLSLSVNSIPTISMPSNSIYVSERERDRYNSFGEQLAAVLQAGIPGGQVDPRLRNAVTGGSESVPSDGGFLVQTDFTQELLQDVFATGILASQCRRQTISSNSNSMKINGVDETSRATGSRGGGIQGYWADEADQKTASKPKFRKIELNLKKLVGLCYLTDELLEDAAALESYVRSGFVSEFGFLLDDAIVNGTGAGQPLGIMNANCLVSQAAETGQQAGTVIAENVIKMYSRLFASSRSSAAWYINQAVEPQLFTMKIDIGTGGQLIYMPAGGISQSPYGTLLGLPVKPIEQCQAPGTTGDIILADFKNGYILADKGGIKSDMSIHVRFIYDESVFRFVLRIDGQPVRGGALTPFKGGSTATQSHFVALATRA